MARRNHEYYPRRPARAKSHPFDALCVQDACQPALRAEIATLMKFGPAAGFQETIEILEAALEFCRTRRQKALDTASPIQLPSTGRSGDSLPRPSPID